MSALCVVMEDAVVSSRPSDRVSPAIEDVCVPLERRLRDMIGEARFEQWFDGKVTWQFEGDKLCVLASSEFAAAWIRGKFLSVIEGIVQDIQGQRIAVEVKHSPRTGRSGMREGVLNVRQGAAGIAAIAVSASGAASAGGASNLPTTAAATSTSSATAFCQTASPFAGAAAGRRLGAAASLNPKYTLEEFIVGAGNQLAYQAALRVAEKPGADYSPLFVHGLCGLGKTHLLQGICRRFGLTHPQGRWLYLTGEQFTNEFLEALRRHKMDDFRRKLRRADLLVIDDVHFFSGKKATQEEFLHTFNQVDAQGRQIVLASDCAPRDILTLAESLMSRFVSGMVARIDPPDMPTRLEILRRRAKRMNWQASDAVLMRIAQSDVASVRELEGLLLQVIAGKELCGDSGAGSSSLAEQILQRTQISRPIAPERITDAVAEFFAVGRAVVIGQSRDRVAAGARGIAMYLMRKYACMSFPDIGRKLGNRNHSTAIAACQRVEAQLAAGSLIRWTAVDGPRQESVASVVQNLISQLRRPPMAEAR